MFSHRSESMRTLAEIIEQHLIVYAAENDKPETILSLVVDEYTQELQKSGRLLAHHVRDAQEEFQELALEIIRKRTYGCLTIGDFRRHMQNRKIK